MIKFPASPRLDGFEFQQPETGGISAIYEPVGIAAVQFLYLTPGWHWGTTAPRHPLR